MRSKNGKKSAFQKLVTTSSASWLASGFGLGALLFFGIYGQNCGGSTSTTPTSPLPAKLDPVIQDPAIVTPPDPDPSTEIDTQRSACLPSFRVHDPLLPLITDFNQIRRGSHPDTRLQLIEAEVHVSEGSNGDGPGQLNAEVVLHDGQSSPYVPRVKCSIAPRTNWLSGQDSAIFGNYEQIFILEGVPRVGWALWSYFNNQGRPQISIRRDANTLSSDNFLGAIEAVYAHVRHYQSWNSIDEMAIYQLKPDQVDFRIRRSERGSIFRERHVFKIGSVDF